MNYQSTINTPATDLIIKQIIKSWATQNKAITDFFTKHDNDVYLSEVAPGRSRAIYILGHLVAVSDSLLPLLGLGDKLYPQYEAMFITSPDKLIADIPTIDELKQNWAAVNEKLTAHFDAMSSADWMGRHTRVSEEDFAKDPTRNKLNVLLSRTIHEGYHIGQLAFLNPIKQN